MPLALDERRLLPPGVHDATLDEAEPLFGRFQRTDRRMTLPRKLKDRYPPVTKPAGAKMEQPHDHAVCNSDRPKT